MSESKHQESKEEQVSNYQVYPDFTIDENSDEVFAVRFSPDGRHLVAGCGDGSTRVFNSSNGDLVHRVEGGTKNSLPTTCIRFRPNTSLHRQKDVFVTAHSNGIVQHWQMTSNACLHTFTDHAEQVFAVDYNDSGSQFVTAGRDGKIRIYDEDSKEEIICLQGGLLGDYDREAPGHSNRVFSVKFTHDEHILLSGGWDNTVQIWDTRQACAVRSLHGTHICGDALDLKHDSILTGSWREKDQLELWDFGSGERIASIPWHPEPGDKPCMLYAAQFSKDSMGRFIVAGGSGQNEAKIFDHVAGDAPVGFVSVGGPVLSVDFSPDGEKVAVAGGDKCIHLLEVTKKRDYYY
mmetsp:Transcript_17948/g.30028  ORF Transcript_17948/g.30028 Transcript_17948/m.30028 type:complete len:349 (+) Transcript_17948:75-1121(+)|eukprot:CAMPEP_0114430158 /NCGR_PEP_ID=MMETSP0103-20121206/9884_1 /TAXON_ID=37642 ORGANISM="Paraphysomonas imperforata, Strain PA2" /NCGR_SAMPLE_ID=MMETSP0103 /ASSEMBLY_ACC=CAM_ASM_000201 /LENGTH=348 /DNA_ID=CAMNT_0001599571 /DNA_START=43 /DNA_END=1089 /DNA_ORIENTATION=-